MSEGLQGIAKEKTSKTVVFQKWSETIGRPCVRLQRLQTHASSSQGAINMQSSQTGDFAFCADYPASRGAEQASLQDETYTSYRIVQKTVKSTLVYQNRFLDHVTWPSDVFSYCVFLFSGYIYIYIYIYIYLCVCFSVCVCARVCVCMCVRV